jgi:phenylacetate-CoA ligase
MTTTDETLRLPLEELVDQTNRAIDDRQLYQQAYQSILYKKLWKAAGIKPEELRGRQGLKELPLINGNDLLAMMATGRDIRNTLVTHPRTWITSRGTTGDKKWLPLTPGDIAHWFNRVGRLNQMYPTGTDNSAKTFFAINEPMPRVSNALPYLWERADYRQGAKRFEWLIGSMGMLAHNRWDGFVFQKQPHWMMSSVDDARRFENETNIDNVSKHQEAFTRLQRGFFWGEPLEEPDGVRRELEDTYGLEESFSIYLSTECREMYAECPVHDGLHLWMDGLVHEIIPDQDPNHTLYLDQASPGITGEYILTAPYEALPLIRYRTGDRIQVISTEPCDCGITHPRVLFNGRMTTPEQKAGNTE